MSVHYLYHFDINQSLNYIYLATFLVVYSSLYASPLVTLEEEVRCYIDPHQNVDEQIKKWEQKPIKTFEDNYAIALMYYYQGKIFKCIQYSEIAFKLLNNNNSEKEEKRLKVQRLIGAAYSQVGYIEEGIALLDKVKSSCLAKQDTTSVCVLLNSIASAYARNGFYGKALETYKEALSLIQNHKNSQYLKPTIFINLIFLYSVRKEYNLSIAYSDSMKPYYDTLSAKLKNAFLLYSTHPMLYLGKTKEALNNFKTAENFYFNAGAYPLLLSHYPPVLNLLLEEKQYEKLIFYHKRYITCLDSTQKIQQYKLLQKNLLEKEREKNLQMRHEIEIKQSKIRHKNLLLLFLSVLLLSILLTFVFIYKKIQLQRSREQQKAQQLLIQEHEQNQILQLQKIQQLEENQRLKEYINHKLEHEVQQRTQELLQKEKEILELKAQKMELQIQQAEKEALLQTLLLQEKTKILETVYNQIQEFAQKAPTEKQKQEMLSMLNFLKSSINTEQQWNSFKMYFENLYPTFIQKIAQNYPQLTQQELRYIAYFKLGLSNKEIAKLLNINPASVRVAKHRIKEKIRTQSQNSEPLEFLYSDNN